ncbi:MAG: glycoside hydrolase family 172 protein [Promethearchaeota archaeon]
MKMGKNNLKNIAKLRPDSIKRCRISSYDKSGDNYDWIDIKPGDKVVLGAFEGAGCITHIWSTCMCVLTKYSLRNAIIRMYWDGEPDDKPSVEVPIGDFFGLGHGKRRNFVSAPLQMSPNKGKGFNCWWPMPFSKGFKITLENDNKRPFRIYYYIDFEVYDDGFPDNKDYGRFHAQWRRENPPPVKKKGQYKKKKIKKVSTKKPVSFNLFGFKNTEPLKYNYKIMEAKGKGHFCGCHLDIDNRTFMPWFINWPGEGDDMIFIDDDVEKGIPTLYGTGTEDYVNQAFCPTETQSAPYHGTILPGGFNWWGKITYYRYHIEDPIYFNKQIIVSIEHGHDNHRSDDWSSTAYWYQTEPHDHSIWPELRDRKGRKPKGVSWIHMIRKTLFIFLILFIVYWFWLKDFIILLLNTLFS